MHLEIERKFLIAHEGWRSSVQEELHLRDGLIADDAGRKVRVRICNGSGSLTIKGRRQGLARSEFTYDLPLHEAEGLLRTVCEGRVVEKVRYLVPHEGFTWSVDVYGGVLAGVVIAEVELQFESQEFGRPDWIGQEVTGDPQYSKINLLAARRGE
ncbi:CYTH domain-containing protein [Chelativorans sp. YIM 93263]|uniref:CYTH domain-containing protein n=1 Tax=Chelativorans sp. YIM 93263 TaxID=2906648 RepID=UPI0023799551|nr:CYTH domain-containing protein [Chelativorans sp. YIM 93263]